jgi:type III restriction enzyme
VSGIDATPGAEYLEFTNGEVIQKRQEAMDDEIKRGQIKWTIEAHLDKEARLLDKGIKVLSLFFIDRVANYRIYDEDAGAKGKYAMMFEEEYLKLIKSPRYSTLFTSDAARRYSLNDDVAAAHKGYFSEDKKGHYKDSSESRATKDDESTYDLIMKKKELLLSFETPVRFIFSHSALREGWDNPNVFQICTLVDTKDTMTKRQKIGRGLRLPVNQEGERIFDETQNVLTVVANESYESFAENLQMEIECETGLRFGIIEERLFDNILSEKDGRSEPIGYEAAKRLVQYLRDANLLDRHGRATSALKEAIVNEVLTLPEEFDSIARQVIEAIKSVTKRLPVANKRNGRPVRLNKLVYLSPEFKELWDKIKWKTMYRLDFDVKTMIDECIETIMRDMPTVKPSPIVSKWVNLQVERGGITVTDPHRTRDHVRTNFGEKNLPNVMEYIERHTGLKRATLARILVESRRLDECYANPQKFMEEVIRVINEKKRVRIADNIKYERIGDTTFWAQELFEDGELTAYLEDNALPVKEDKSMYDHIIWDSTVEESFAKRLDEDDDVKLFVKLPKWFKIETPLGTYNPDWAVVIEINGERKLYFVLETKKSSSQMDLRLLEKKKFTCGQQHFVALNTGITCDMVETYDDWRRDLA